MVNLRKQMRNKTTVLVTQKLSLLNLTQRVIVLQDGRIYIDGPKEVVLKKLNGNTHV